MEEWEEDCLEDLIGALEGPFPSLDHVCHHQHLLELAPRITEWKTVAFWLGFERTAVEDLDCKRYDGEGKRQEMLYDWKQVNGSDATYRELAGLMMKCGRKNLAESVVKLSNKALRSLPRPISSNHSSPNYQTPQGTSRPHSTYLTPSISPNRSFPSASREPADNGLLLIPRQPHNFSTPVAQQQPTIESLQGTSSLSPPQLELSTPTPTEDPSSDKGALCMSRPAPFIPHGVRERVNSVCERAPSHGLPTVTTTEMRQLLRKIERMEMERQTSQEWHDTELALMKRANEREKGQLERHLEEAEADNKCLELMVRDLTRKLDQMNNGREEAPDCNGGREETDFSEVFTFDSTTTAMTSSSTTASTASCSRADSRDRHLYYRARSYVCQEEVTATLSYSRRYMEWSGTSEGSTCEMVEEEEEEKRRVVVHRLCRQITTCLEERELRFVERARSELAAHAVSFLEANSRLTEVVSRSLESLNSIGPVGVATADREGVLEDLQWLQSNLEQCRLARHASWP